MAKIVSSASGPESLDPDDPRQSWATYIKDELELLGKTSYQPDEPRPIVERKEVVVTPNPKTKAQREANHQAQGLKAAVKRQEHAPAKLSKPKLSKWQMKARRKREREVRYSKKRPRIRHCVNALYIVIRWKRSLRKRTWKRGGNEIAFTREKVETANFVSRFLPVYGF
jgi:hypothetical protein